MLISKKYLLYLLHQTIKTKTIMRTFNYRQEEVEVEYNTYDDGDKEYHPEIIIEAVYFNGVNILPIMNEADELELKEEMTDNLFA